MAFDWIKMRIGLADDPAVITIARATKLDPDHVCGKLLTLWGWADQNTSDGRLNGVDVAWIDAKVGKKGFAQAMTMTIPPWLEIDPDGVTIPRFDRHNGSSAKSRSENSKRQTLSRTSRDKSATDVAQNARQKRDQRREEKSIITTAHDGEWTEARQTANKLAEQLGPCSKERDRRLLLGAAFISQMHTNGANWLEVAAREVKHSRPENPYAFFQKVACSQADADGIDLRSSIGRLEIPAELLERRKQPA